MLRRFDFTCKKKTIQNEGRTPCSDNASPGPLQKPHFGGVRPVFPCKNQYKMHVGGLSGSAAEGPINSGLQHGLTTQGKSYFSEKYAPKRPNLRRCTAFCRGRTPPCTREACNPRTSVPLESKSPLHPQYLPGPAECAERLNKQHKENH